MTVDEFWSIVGGVHMAAGFDIKKKCALLAGELRKLPPDEIILALKLPVLSRHDLGHSRHLGEVH